MHQGKKSGQNMEYINILIGKKYVRRGFFFLNILQKSGEKYLSCRFFRSTYNLNLNSLIDILWFLGEDSFP